MSPRIRAIKARVEFLTKNAGDAFAAYQMSALDVPYLLELVASLEAEVEALREGYANVSVQSSVDWMFSRWVETLAKADAIAAKRGEG